MSVHYKFKTALNFSTVTFDGIHITVADLKKDIIEQEHLKQNADFDLQIKNAQTEEVYNDDNALIPKNTSVIVARIPAASRRGNSNGPGGGGGGGGPPFRHRQHHPRNPAQTLQPSAVAKGVDLASMDATEEEKIETMMFRSTADYDPSQYQRLRGSGQHGRVPTSYRCNKCNQGGHWIKDCPIQSDHLDVKKSTGIPRSFMVHVEGPDVPGALRTPEGRFAVPAVDHAAYMEQNKPPMAKPPPTKPKIPEELVCTLCNDLMTDALMVPCCANSYCDDCIRKALLESDEQECPGCHEKEISPTSLIPNRFLRSTVNTFKNETGYSKPQAPVDIKKSSVIMVDLTDKKAEEGERRKLSLDELPDDLFPHSPRKIDPEAEAKEKENSANEDEEKTDLYDFNDGSIPSPFASSPRPEVKEKEEQAIRTIGTVGTGTSNMYPGPEPKPPYSQPPSNMSRHHHHSSPHNVGHHHQPPPHHQRPPNEQQYRPPRTPLQSGMPPLPPMHRSHHPPPSRRQPFEQLPPVSGPGPGQQMPHEAREPPPPGFGDILPLPPGEDRVPTPTGRGREENLHRRDEGNYRRDRERGEREMGNPEGAGPPRGSLLPLPGIPPFNPSQPPPGFNPSQPPSSVSQQPPKGPHGPNGPHGLPPPPVYSGPPPGTGPPPPMNLGPPNQNFPPHFHVNYRPPPPGPGNGGHPMFHPGPGPGPGPGGHPMRGPHPRDRDREPRYDSRERALRKPPLREIREPRPRERDRPEEIRAGPIDDPLKEFERLMREKDRRKKMQPVMGKRSRSRSFSPVRRTPPSPFTKRSRSRSFSRSPSPKRKRALVGLRRRKSYSRTPSRSPPRRHVRSRSRSRNRSITPTAQLSIRRSPRRAPPFSPSPPPSRFPPARKEKDDFFDRAPSRYEAGSTGAGRYYGNPPGSGPPVGGSSSNKQFPPSSSRDYGEGPPPPTKFEAPIPSKYMVEQKYEQQQGVGPSGPPGQGPPGLNKFDKFDARSSNRERESYHHHSGGSSVPTVPSSAYRDHRERERDTSRGAARGDRDRDRDHHETREREREREREMREHKDREAHRQVPYDFDPGILPPGTESHVQQSNLAPVPSLFELHIPPPLNYPPPKVPTTSDGYYPPTHHSTSAYQHQQSHHHQPQQQQQYPPSTGLSQKDRRSHGQSEKEIGNVESLSKKSITPDSEIDSGRSKDRGREKDRERERERDRDREASRDGKKPHHKKSRDSSVEKTDKKKERKEKKKHKKKKEKEEKKSRKSSRSSKPSDRQSKDEGSDDEPVTATAITADLETGSLLTPNKKDLGVVSDANTDGRTIESGIIPLNLLHGNAELVLQSDSKSIEKSRGVAEMAGQNSNLTVIVCDSTVKSPERSLQPASGKHRALTKDAFEVPAVEKAEIPSPSGGATVAVDSKLDSTDLYGGIEMEKDQIGAHADAFVKEEQLALNLKDEEISGEPDKIECEMALPVIASKWDEFGEDDEDNGETLNKLAPDGAQTLDGKDGIKLFTGQEEDKNLGLKSVGDKKVTSEILKKAENAIFQKAISAISVVTSRSSSATRRSPPPSHHSASTATSSSSSKRKVYLEHVDASESEKQAGNSNDAENSEGRKGSATSEMAGVKRSVRDRLGSKIPEDTHSSSSRNKEKASPPDVRDRTRDKHVKSEVGRVTSRDRDRDRDARDRKRIRSKSRSPSPRVRRIARNSRSKSREPARVPRERDRERHSHNVGVRPASPSHKRSLSRTQRGPIRRTSHSRSSSRTRRRHELNRHRTPLTLVGRSRSRSATRVNRGRDSRSRSRPRDPTRLNSGRDRDRDRPDRVRERDEHERFRKEPDEREREPSPPGESGRAFTPPVVSKIKTEEDWKRQANKFVPIVGVGENIPSLLPPKTEIFSKASDGSFGSATHSSVWQGGSNPLPVPLSVRKQKGRINIKLSSTTTSKRDEAKSSSSSSDEDDHDHGSKTEGGPGKKELRSSLDSDDSRRDDKKRRKDRKKGKRRRSESSSSSGSDDSAPRKSKKGKKKKKKSKKKKRVK